MRIAVGREAVVRGVEPQTGNRVEMSKGESEGQLILRDADFAYG